MKTAKVRLYIRIRRPDGSRPFVDPVFAGNLRLRPQMAMVNGKPVHCPEGVYHLRYTRAGTRMWESVGSDPALATIAVARKQRELDAIAVGILPDQSKPRNSLAEASASYLQDVGFTRSSKTLVAYSETMRGFLESCPKRYVEDLDRKDIFGYIQYLRRKGNDPRTVYNRLTFLRTFFRTLKMPFPLEKGDWPTYTAKVVSCYRQDELTTMLKAASLDEQDWIHFFLCSGGRKQEVQFATWSDIDFKLKTMSVWEKLDLGFRPKDREEGTIPLPGYVIEMLRSRRLRNPKTTFIFERATGKNEDHFGLPGLLYQLDS